MYPWLYLRSKKKRRLKNAEFHEQSNFHRNFWAVLWLQSSCTMLEEPWLAALMTLPTPRVSTCHKKALKPAVRGQVLAAVQFSEAVSSLNLWNIFGVCHVDAIKLKQNSYNLFPFLGPFWPQKVCTSFSVLSNTISTCMRIYSRMTQNVGKPLNGPSLGYWVCKHTYIFDLKYTIKAFWGPWSS